MDPVSQAVNNLVGMVFAFLALQVCVAAGAIVVGIAVLIWWIQTLVLCAEQEQGENKIVWVLIIIFIGPLGALLYRLVRTSPSDNAASRYGPEVQRAGGFSGGQVATLMVLGGLVGVVFCCGSVFTYGALNPPPPPTLQAGQPVPIVSPIFDYPTLDFPTYAPPPFLPTPGTLLSGEMILTEYAQTSAADTGSQFTPAPEATATRYVIHIDVSAPPFPTSGP